MAFGALIGIELFIIIGIPWLVVLLISFVMLVKNILGLRKALSLSTSISKSIVMILLWGIASLGLSVPICLVIIIWIKNM